MIEILSQLKSVREKALKICNSESVISDEDIECFIRHYRKGEILNNCDLNKSSSIFYISREMQNCMETNSNDIFAIRGTFNVYIIPYKDGKVYGAWYYNNINSYKSLLEPYVEEYHYQNQADQPDEISDEEWDERKNIWDDIFSDYWSFPEVGYHYSIIAPRDIHIFNRIEEIIDKIRLNNEKDNV